MPTFSLGRPPPLAFAAASSAARRSPTDPAPWTTRGEPRAAGFMAGSRSFGAELEPRYIIRAGSLDQ